jgi:putative colanic acid biosynthesis UDP-glucose lipid carrier transferase
VSITSLIPPRSSGSYPPTSGLLRQYGDDLSRLQRLLDPLIATGLFLLIVGNLPGPPYPLVLPRWLWVLLLTALILPSGNLYGSFRQASLLLLARRVTSRWMTVIGTLLLLAYFTKTSALFSREATTIWALLTWLLLLLNHVGLRKLLRHHRSRGGNARTVLYWGTAEPAAAFQAELLSSPWMGLRLVAWFSPVPEPVAGQPPHLPPCGGGLAEMRRWLQCQSADRIVFSHVPRNELSMDQLLSFFGDTCLPVIYAPRWAQPGMRFRITTVGNTPCIDLWGGESSLLDRQFKRVFDLSLAGFGVLLISPLLLVIALAVRLSSPGPILFLQDRYGLDGRRFRIFKFRTMRVMEAGDQPGLRQASRDDPRVTPVGRLLRRWSLDELPQLFNVLRGDMSLVGPRPHAVQHNELYRKQIPGYMQRHAFRPGITGLAQVEGWRGETATLEAMARRVEADLRYQHNWSFKLDVKILLKTLLRLRSPNAF